MQWLNANWLWLVLIAGMLWMHLGMHRGHGGHGGHGGGHARHIGHDQDRSAATAAGRDTDGGGHRHRGC